MYTHLLTRKKTATATATPARRATLNSTRTTGSAMGWVLRAMTSLVVTRAVDPCNTQRRQGNVYG